MFECFFIFFLVPESEPPPAAITAASIHQVKVFLKVVLESSVSVFRGTRLKAEKLGVGEKHEKSKHKSMQSGAVHHFMTLNRCEKHGGSRSV